jgi:hypothetical protein
VDFDTAALCNLNFTWATNMVCDANGKPPAPPPGAESHGGKGIFTRPCVLHS